MRKFSLFVLALFTGSLLQAQNLPSYVPANGLVGWWPFNGNANDESGNNNNGTVNGATLTTDRFGNAGKAYSFDGLSNYIKTPTNNFPSVAKTISFWLNSEDNNQRGLLAYGGSGNCGDSFILNINMLSCDGANKLTMQSHCCIDTLSIPISYIPIQKWNFVSFVADSNGSKIYVNGLLARFSPDYDTTIVTTTDFAIGTAVDLFGNAPFTDFNANYYKGKLDDIAIYNRALTQQEITALYQGANTSANCLQMPANLQQGLVGYWPFCGNANDESGNGNHGTVNGATLTADRFGNTGSAYQFNGSEVIDIPNSNQFGFGTDTSFTVGAWLKIQSINDFFRVFLAYMCPDQLGNLGGFQLAVESSGSNPLLLQGPAFFQSNDGLSDENWHNSIVVFNRNTDSCFLYLDKILVGKAPINPSYTFSPSCNYSLKIGGERSGQLIHYFKGSLDDIAIWNRALSQQEITQLYNQGICQTSITVTDTLLIHTGITSYNPVAYGNTLKVWPNPGNQDITLDAGNLSSMQGWKYKVANTLGQTVVNETVISQQQTLIDLSTWGGNGIYYLHLINPQGHAIEIKKIVLAP
jgi:hypothetical protein